MQNLQKFNVALVGESQVLKKLLRLNYIQNNRSQLSLDSTMQENEYLWQWSCVMVCACSTGFSCCVTASQKAFRCRVGRNSIIYSLYYSTAAWLFFLMSVEAQRLIRSVWDFKPPAVEETKAGFEQIVGCITTSQSFFFFCWEDENDFCLTSAPNRNT